MPSVLAPAASEKASTLAVMTAGTGPPRAGAGAHLTSDICPGAKAPNAWVRAFLLRPPNNVRDTR
ncbi:MAG TPA: hypothetical protein VFQ61_28845 [Polyangiaceae bacterium]|nr:hypothetical protein [Polyangiaceae bacterium]